MMMYRLLLLTAGLKLNHKKCGCAPSSVIKIVKMKYNRIDIKNTPLKAVIKQNHTVYM